MALWFGRVCSAMAWRMSGVPTKAPPASAQVSKTKFMEVLILVLMRSNLKKIVGEDALRMVLPEMMDAIMRGDSRAQLEPVWTMLASQPNFEAEQAFPPLSLLKSWEPVLGVAVVLPAAMNHLTVIPLSNKANLCRVQRSELDTLLLVPTVSQTAAK